MPDIFMLDSGNPIKNGTRLVFTGGKSTFALMFKTLNDDVSNEPNINLIDDKYENRLDDPRYYTGDTAN
jgi:hypothetical protein